MADKHTHNYEVRELKLGGSFTNSKATQYHTIKYDFKPASVDVNKMATVNVGTNNQVTVTVPHLDGAGVPQTVFKGNQRPYTKECVLIIDRVTGEITLEKLSSNIQVKKTRQEHTMKPRPLTPGAGAVPDLTNTTQRSSSRTRVTTNKRTPNPVSSLSLPNGPPGRPTPPLPPHGQHVGQNSGQHSKPLMVRSPQRLKTSPPQAAPWSGGGNSTLASLPMIGLEDLAPPAPAAMHSLHTQPDQPPQQDDSSSSSSSDSDSGSGSDSDSDDNDSSAKQSLTNGAPAANTSLPSDVLNDDLCLSDTNSRLSTAAGNGNEMTAPK